MGLSVPTQKDISEYQEKIVAGLSLRRLVCLSVGAVACAGEAVFCTAVLHADVSRLSIPILATMGLAFAFGFVRPLGLDFKTAAGLFATQWFGDRKLVYKSSVTLRNEAARAESAPGGQGRSDLYGYPTRKESRKRARCAGCERDIPILAATEAAVGLADPVCAEAVAPRAEAGGEGRRL